MLGGLGGKRGCGKEGEASCSIVHVVAEDVAGFEPRMEKGRGRTENDLSEICPRSAEVTYPRAKSGEERGVGTKCAANSEPLHNIPASFFFSCF